MSLVNELVKQAKTDCSGKWISLENAEQLVELIVRECATIADNEVRNPAGCGWITKTKGQLIKEQFGVEE